MASLESKTLLELILDEANKAPNMEGNTPLILKAIKNSKLDNLSKEKESLENEVCSLVNWFSKFDQTHFSELDSYITTSKFNTKKILSSFSVFVKEKQEEEDIYLKGCVLRFIQIYNKSLFQLDYIKERFHELEENDAWLYAELIINNNWGEGVNEISNILKRNNDTSYLFALIINWMTSGESEGNLNFAFNTWIKYFNVEDKELLKEFCNQYSYNLNIDKLTVLPQTSELSNSILNSSGLNGFIKAGRQKKFESIPS